MLELNTVSTSPPLQLLVGRLLVHDGQGTDPVLAHSTDDTDAFLSTQVKGCEQVVT